MSKIPKFLPQLALLVTVLFLFTAPTFAEEVYNEESDSYVSDNSDVTPTTEAIPSTTSVFAPDVTTTATTTTATTPEPKTTFPVKDRNYLGLLEALPLYEDALHHPWPVVPDTDRLLKRGSRGEAVAILRERLRRTKDLSDSDPDRSTFDDEVEDAVKTFQWRHGLDSDGVVGNDTLNALNVPAEVRVKQLRLNIQRWEQFSKMLKSRYVFVNIPEFRLHVIDNNQEVLAMKVIVGKPELPTPVLASRINRIVFNPAWHVPPRIAQNDIVPKMIENPSYLNQNHIRIFNSEQDGSREISPGSVDWDAAESGGFQYTLRQDPGSQNALGLVKFEFPNKYHVYLHDSPAKNLFNQDFRALSHGCVRLEKAFSLVSYLIQDDQRLNEGDVQNRVDNGKTTYFSIKNPINVYIAYLTAWVDENNLVNFRDDIYHLDNASI